MPEPLGVRPAVDEQRRHAFDIRHAIARRFGADADAEHGEGKLTAQTADAFVQAVIDQDKPTIALLREVISEVCGPQRQGLDVQARVYSIVRIVGEEDEEGDV